MVQWIRLRLLEIQKENDQLKNTIIKSISILLLFVIGLLFGLIPYFIISCRKSNKFLSLSNSFSAGIFLSMGLIHILPESAEMLKDFSDIPFAYIICFLSYAFILFIEKVAFSSSHSLLHKNYNEKLSEYEESDIKDEDSHQELRGKKKESDENLERQESRDEISKNEQSFVVKINNNQENTSPKDSRELSFELNNKENKIEEKSEIKNIITSYFLLFVLSFHGLFEGISLGIQSTIKRTLFLLLAIGLHKWAASLSLGISFIKNGIIKKHLIFMMIIFSSMTPIGISIGMFLSSFSNIILAGIFLSISVGIFIYISCSEIIIDEFSHGKYKCCKFLFFLLGAGVVISLSIFEISSESGHEHIHL